MKSRFLNQKTYLRSRDRDLEDDCESSLLLGTDENDSDENNRDSNSLRGRNFALRPKRPTSHFVEHTLQTSDTLSSLALKYNCSVAQIKQANNILRDNEVFALRKIRIPVPALTSWKDEVPGVHSTHHNPKKSSEQSDLVVTDDACSSITSDHKWVEESPLSESVEELHDPLLTPIPVPLLPLVDLSDRDPPDLGLAISSNQVQESDGLWHCSGADCGISWVYLVACTILLGFIYIFFLYEREHEKKMHNHAST